MLVTPAHLLFIGCWCFWHATAIVYERTELRMPSVKPNKADTYLCRSMELDDEFDHYLVGFEPHGSEMTAHHILLYGCSEPGSKKPIWECNEMNSGFGESPCGSGQMQIIYAWAHDAPKLDLPTDVGFRVGGDSPSKYLVLQIHYMHQMKEADNSGLTLVSTREPMPKTAATMLVATGGGMAAGDKKGIFEAACVIDEPVTIHPFAFRTHTHQHGRLVSGWKVSKDDKNSDTWKLIGKKDPRQPQMFYPVDDDKMTLSQGDVIAARCTMENNEQKDVLIGASGDDEMCNFYVMYWVGEGEETLSDNTCISPGPPEYYWGSDAKLANIPQTA